MRDWSPLKIRQAFPNLSPPLFSLKKIDRETDLKLGACRSAIRIPHRAAERAIAKKLNVPPQKIWPSCYYPDGTRRSPQPPENYKPQNRPVECQNEEAA